ncbi:glycosyltransferase family 4 protein [Dermatophilus congolensis]|uniref:glycosyltransferase family 4 protein n=1 Tax=Dermatophilus congolensis TaxID=1863 RepID=UPI001AB01C31|nr:glycosyltransferase family 4 protein [Dermatophilus congolensis]MBO3129941.1 glycosyltransferase family 4 protein [Dermatophilus congolensis]MBO3131429.1 glycosyltransferase family 4 protein [Dermatophilus congolensis]MBO3134415.1 glycosyltransferase family 4 protein [Dermatophilus congolensis]MBO3136651.1 glycosyltransferase family 4 protein [Dermatophilus congolensis]MBO3138895.1 glycosyltransferase family 4 protein [Dermatophilus congolensis]
MTSSTGPRILIAAPYYTPAWRGGGPIRSLAAITNQHGDRHHFLVITSAYDWGGVPLDVDTTDWVRTGSALVRYLPTTFGSLNTIPAYVRAWRQATSSPSGPPDITYLTGAFPPLWTLLPLLLARTKILSLGRVLIAPRGEFGTGALALKAKKKRCFLAAARFAGLYRDVTWHASSSAEAVDIRSVFPEARILIRQNETDLPTCATRPRTLTTSALRLLYLGRLSPKKGIETFLAALRYVNSPVQVTIAGTADSDEYASTLRALANKSKHPVSFVGGIERNRVQETFCEHDLFVFPTTNENFGHTVAESLSAAVPVMLHRGSTPWPVLLPHVPAGALELLDTFDPRDWAEHIDAVAARSPEQRLSDRQAAADAYDAWRACTPTQSVFDMLLEQ